MRYRTVYVLSSCFSFSFGFFLYLTIEILYKRFFSGSPTHFSMGLLAGISFVFLYFLDDSPLGFGVKMLAGGVLITVLEFFLGIYLNLYLQLGIWDYRDQPFDLLGQICPVFSLIWVAFSGAVIGFNRFLKRIVKFLCLCD